MPLIKPEIQKVLRASGLEREEAPEGTISEKLDRAGLSTTDIAEELTKIATSSGNETLRLRALETAMKAHGVLKDSASVQVPSFTVVIQHAGSGSENTKDLNQILFPRQSLEGSQVPKQEKVN